MNESLIIGNLCTLLAMGANAFSSTRKTGKGVLAVQTVGQGIYFISAMFLRGYSAAVQNVVSILRNFVAICNGKSKALEWILTAAGVVLGLVFNNRGILGLLPVLGNLEYTVAIFRFKDNGRAIKISFVICVALYVVYNFAISNFVGAVADTIVIATTLAALVKEK